MLGKEDISEYSTHSIRKTKSSIIYDKTQNVEIVRRLLGHQNSSATVNYLGIEDSDALDVCRTINV
jgi:integrase